MVATPNLYLNIILKLFFDCPVVIRLRQKSLPKTTTTYQPSTNRSLSALHITRNHICIRPAQIHYHAKKKNYLFQKNKEYFIEK